MHITSIINTINTKNKNLIYKLSHIRVNNCNTMQCMVWHLNCEIRNNHWQQSKKKKVKLTYEIGHFQVNLWLFFQNESSCKACLQGKQVWFAWKWICWQTSFLYELTYTLSDTDAKGNLEMAYLHWHWYCKINNNKVNDNNIICYSSCLFWLKFINTVYCHSILVSNSYMTSQSQ